MQDPIKIKDAEQYELSPLILYGLTVAGLPIRWIIFTPADQPRAFRDVLLEAWHNAEGLRGRPNILRINRHLALASPDLVKEMAKLDVHVEIASAKEKSLPASLRSAQNFCRELLWELDRKDRSLSRSIQVLCRYAQEDHNSRVSIGVHRGVNSREIEDRIKQWLSRPVQSPVQVLTGGLDWKPGPWLSSWESSLPPNPSRYFNDCSTCLLTGEKAPEAIVEDDDFCADSYYDNAAEIVKNLVACWPNSPAEIAKCLGITLRKLQWFTSGKAPLDRHTRFDLEELLGIKYDESTCMYRGVGPYVLIASKPKAVEDAYEHLSHGGDANPFEIIPSEGAADPSWRFFLINTYGEPPSIFMSPRGEKISERLPDLLLNYTGITPVSPEFYRDVVSTCARACREPAANICEMNDFVKRYEDRWIDCAWEPEY